MARSIASTVQRLIAAAGLAAAGSGRGADVLDLLEAATDDAETRDELRRLGVNVEALRAALAGRTELRPRWWRRSQRPGTYPLRALMEMAERFAEARQTAGPLDMCLLWEVMLMVGGAPPGLLRAHGLGLLSVRRLAAHGLFPDDPAWRLEPTPVAEQVSVVFHNDAYTTQEFVVEVLEAEMGLPPDEAVQVMMDVHHEGRGGAGSFPLAEATQRAAAVLARAAQAEHPLRLSLEAG
jgi:ATP-dependent Clp protease adaptor protein ClpS